MDNFFRTVEKRHSVRSFTEKPVEKTKTQKILMVARISPSAKGLQSYRIFIIEDKKNKKRNGNKRRVFVCCSGRYHSCKLRTIGSYRIRIIQCLDWKF